MSFDSTLGSPTGNSYVSVAQADTYFAASRPASATLWAAQITADKQQALMAATNRLDGLSWVGRRLAGPPTPAAPTIGQLLAWPRYGVYVDGWWVSTDTIPRGLLLAVCELALTYLVDPTTDPEGRTGLEGITNVKIGGLALTVDDLTTVSPGQLPPVVLRALRGLTYSLGSTRVTR